MYNVIKINSNKVAVLYSSMMYRNVEHMRTSNIDAKINKKAIDTVNALFDLDTKIEAVNDIDLITFTNCTCSIEQHVMINNVRYDFSFEIFNK